MTNSRLTDPEILEDRFPVRLRAVCHPPRQRRGGPLARRGRGGAGAGFLEPMTAAILSGSRRVAPFGLAGGEPGSVGRNRIEPSAGPRRALEGCDQVAMEPGDRLVIETPGGGGYGPPAALGAKPIGDPSCRQSPPARLFPPGPALRLLALPAPGPPSSAPAAQGATRTAPSEHRNLLQEQGQRFQPCLVGRGHGGSQRASGLQGGGGDPAPGGQCGGCGGGQLLCPGRHPSPGRQSGRWGVSGALVARTVSRRAARLPGWGGASGSGIDGPGSWPSAGARPWR